MKKALPYFTQLAASRQLRGALIFKQCPVTLEGLDRQLGTYARFSKTATVTIRCMEDSPQSRLIQVLDVCAKHKLRNLSIFSL